MNIINVNNKIVELKNMLEYGTNIEDFINSTDTIQDTLSEMASDSIDVYYSELLTFVSDHSECMDDVVHDGLYDLNPQTYNFFEHVQAAQWYYASNQLNDDASDIVLFAAYVHCQDIGKESLTEDENNQLIDIVDNIDITSDSFADEYKAIDEIFTE